MDNNDHICYKQSPLNPKTKSFFIAVDIYFTNKEKVLK